MNVEDYKYLIIGGVPKAGTSSLYKYISDHPNANCSILKEVRFFLDEKYPLRSSSRFNGENLDEYNSFFSTGSCFENKIRVEATPDYLYSGTALKIAELLPNAKILFILRDPAERMVSWYKFAIQCGMINAKLSFDEYVMMQVNKPVDEDTPVHLRALEQCKYEKYLMDFRSAFGERMMVLDFVELKNNTKKVMKDVCVFMDVDARFFDNYKFTVENESYGVRSGWLSRIYRNIRPLLTYMFYSSPVVMKILKKINSIFKKLLTYNKVEAASVVITSELAHVIDKEAKQI